jgi:DNA polymerase I
MLIEGYLFDVHPSSCSTHMIAWILDAHGSAHRCPCPWRPTLQVSGQYRDLKNLELWLEQPEIQTKYSICSTRYIKARLDLEEYEIHKVLEIEVSSGRILKHLGQHIEHKGDFTKFTLYSLDANLVQRFLNESQVSLFERVIWRCDSNRLSRAEHTSRLKLRAIELAVIFDTATGFRTLSTPIASVEFRPLEYERELIESAVSTIITVDFTHSSSLEEALLSVQKQLRRIDPDIVCTRSGDKIEFPALLNAAQSVGIDLYFGRDDSPLVALSQARTVWSYGQALRKNAYHPLRGRIHLDISSSFIVREGGISGLIELARLSNQSAQDISRLSPGSVISAIQIRTAMDDGVLVPWKKNRPEDTKTALELLHSDRGGLYLDSTPGCFSNVIELDYASLFPSIIATRNISSETLNCPCCVPLLRNEHTLFLPLDVQEASDEMSRRNVEHRFGSGLFPQSNEFALRVPGLNLHTCGRRQGFLGRVVGPIIQRRRELKRLRVFKKDRYDLQQNALKWLLVTCFGYTGYRNARFGRIEAHEAICAWAREILLFTIEEAQNAGWEVLHAVVDSVWIRDVQGRSRDEQLQAAYNFASDISQKVGIPLEFEDMYRCIAFVPSRVHKSGTLTKYWGWNGSDFKIRGIELRQHSTCKWTSTLQSKGLALLVEHLEAGEHLPSYRQQREVHALFHTEYDAILNSKVDLNAFVVSRRITKTRQQRTVMNLTHAALLRAEKYGMEIPAGGRIHFVVIDQRDEAPIHRIILQEELSSETRGTVDAAFYIQDANRALWSILSPFGWSEGKIERKNIQCSLNDFVHSI